MSKCNQCGFENKDTSKFCIQCGTKLERTCPQCGTPVPQHARFCMGCGANLLVEAGTGISDPQIISHVELSPMALGLPECHINITEASAEGPNEDGEYRIDVKYEVTNDSSEDWEYLDVRIQLLNAAGLIVEETRDTQEQTIIAGESAEFESAFWGVKAGLLGPQSNRAHVVAGVIACGLSQQKLGEIGVPETPFEMTSLKQSKIGDVLKLVCGSFWKTEPEDDNDCRVEIKVLVQNLSDRHLPLVKMETALVDKRGGELADASGSDEIRPGSIAVISGSGYGNERDFGGAKANATIKAYYPVAAGITQQCGLSITASDQSEWIEENKENEISTNGSEFDQDGVESEDGDGYVDHPKIFVGYIAHIRNDWSIARFGEEISFYADKIHTILCDKDNNIGNRIEFIVGIDPERISWNIFLKHNDGNEDITIYSKSGIANKSEDGEAYYAYGKMQLLDELEKHIDFDRLGEDTKVAIDVALTPYLIDESNLDDDFASEVMCRMGGSEWIGSVDEDDQIILSENTILREEANTIPGSLVLEIYPDCEIQFDIDEDGTIIFDVDDYVDRRNMERHYFGICRQI